MKRFKTVITLLCLLCFGTSTLYAQTSRVGLTLIPPSPITNKVNLDVRAGVVNNDNSLKSLEISIYLNNYSDASLLHYSKVELQAGQAHKVQLDINTADRVGKNKILLKVKGRDESYELCREIEVLDSDIRSTRQIDGAWASLYHWSETEGKHWNGDIKRMTDDQWRELVRSMHSIEMDMIVIQELFRNEFYVGRHDLTVENYDGLAFYPSDLYAGRMPLAAKDPLEAILSEASKYNMSVMVGVGMFAWFDFTPESLAWHKRVAKELWDKYGHHESFYAFYVSEECAGDLHNGEPTLEGQLKRKKEIADFFREFKSYCNTLAPEKPVMLATNSMGVLSGADNYPALLQNLDILCPFGFARMPEGDLTGKQAALKLQQFCDEAGAHLWFDLEAFLFNPDMSLYPRPVESIIHDLSLFDNFEKVLCYQFPGVFNDPQMSIRIGEERTVKLFNDYKEYLKKVKKSRKK